jgi:hypothetical protein
MILVCASGRSLVLQQKSELLHCKIRQIRGNSARLKAEIDLHRVLIFNGVFWRLAVLD